MKRKLPRLLKRSEIMVSEKRARVTSPFFLFDASIRIGGGGRFHDELTATTGLVPRKTQLAGDLVWKGSSKTHKQDLWILSSPLDRRLPLEDHLAWLLDAVSPHAPTLNRVISNSAWADLFLGCLSSSPYPVISTDRSGTELVKLLDLTIGFNFTCK